MTYVLIDKRSGNVVGSFDNEADARAFAVAEIERGNEWGLFVFHGDESRLLAIWGPA